ncbi:MAG: UDP-N-acetylmuramate dehydrogenase [Acidobacteria bacterium]|nr:UDP-N-acetylmuramate dehydrogenase [Acidobacteriota bacterium]
MDALAALGKLALRKNAPLSEYTRFAIGGPAAILADAGDEAAFLDALRIARQSGLPHTVIGAGTNLIVSEAGYPGIVLRYTAHAIRGDGNRIVVEAGAVLQQLVDFSIEQGLEGLHTMTGIPGWVGAAIYGNAGAYGHSISEFIERVRFVGGGQALSCDNSACEFGYRESAFKRHKDRVIVSAELTLPSGECNHLREQAARILEIRNAKYPPTMRCAGSIFKNLLIEDLAGAVKAQVPPPVIREGKAPSAWFLEQVGAKGMRRGDIEVAPYHANLIYNTGAGTAEDLKTVIEELKKRVLERFGLALEEEVQYVGL